MDQVDTATISKENERQKGQAQEGMQAQRPESYGHKKINSYYQQASDPITDTPIATMKSDFEATGDNDESDAIKRHYKLLCLRNCTMNERTQTGCDETTQRNTH